MGNNISGLYCLQIERLCICYSLVATQHTDKIRPPDVRSMPGQRRRRWAEMEPAMGQRIVFAGRAGGGGVVGWYMVDKGVYKCYISGAGNIDRPYVTLAMIDLMLPWE